MNILDMKGKFNWILCILIILITGIFIYKESEIRKLKKQLYDLEKRDTYNMQVLLKFPPEAESVRKSDKLPKFSELMQMTSDELNDLALKISTEIEVLDEKHGEALKSIDDAEYELTRNAKTKAIADQVLIDNHHKLKPLKEAEQNILHDRDVAWLTMVKLQWIQIGQLATKVSFIPNELTKCIFLDKNQLYISLSEIEDADFGVSAEDKALNKTFYGES